MATRSTPGWADEPVWRAPDGTALSCYEKLKVLHGNIGEIRAMCQEALEDDVLKGCDEAQVSDILRQLIASLDEPFKD